MNRHLVAVEVRVERGADERMQLDCASLDKYRLESLNRQSVERRSAVQKDRMLLDDVLESVPDSDIDLLDFLLRVLDVGRLLGLDEPLHDERLEELERHLLRETALIDLQVRTDDNNRTSGIVDTLAE